MSSDGKYFGGKKREERVIGSLRLGGSNLKIGGQRRSHWEGDIWAGGHLKEVRE